MLLGSNKTNLVLNTSFKYFYSVSDFEIMILYNNRKVGTLASYYYNPVNISVNN